MSSSTIKPIDGIEPIEILKASREKLVVKPCLREHRACVNVGIQVLTEKGHYRYRTGFMVSPNEARELAAALPAMADAAEQAEAYVECDEEGEDD
jgi:hypothetical protein